MCPPPFFRRESLGRLVGPSLGEWVSTPFFHEALHKSFPAQVIPGIAPAPCGGRAGVRGGFA